ncbi:EamA family transporter [Candidatus Woesearchaeota archaeon]|nr:EamA family transporter [Candidatus Woesearchaeota archaeon]
MMNSVLAAFLAMICWGVGDFLIQKSTRRIGVSETLFLIGFVGSFVLLPFVWFDFKFISSLEIFLFFLFFGIFTYFVSMINLEALRVGKLFVVEVLLEIELPITIILAVLLLKESLSFSLICLFVLVFVGLVFVVLPKIYLVKKFIFEHGTGLAILAAVGMGIINFLTGYIAINISPLLSVWFAWVIFTIITFVFLIKKKKFVWKKYFIKKIDLATLVMCLLDTAAWVFFAFAIVGSGLAVAIGITESYPAIALFLGVFVNKEKITKHQIFGALLVIIVSFCIGFFFG